MHVIEVENLVFLIDSTARSLLVTIYVYICMHIFYHMTSFFPLVILVAGQMCWSRTSSINYIGCSISGGQQFS